MQEKKEIVMPSMGLVYYAISEELDGGYLEIANHNCQFDLIPDQLHKLNTRGVKFDQIIKALEIYSQKNTRVKKGNAIDHLWNIFNKFWPCKIK